MSSSRSASVLEPSEHLLARLTVDAARRAEAMGLIEPGVPRAEMSAVRQLANKIRRAGIGVSSADVLNNVEAPSKRDVAELLTLIIAALDASPAPKYEWKGLSRVFSPDDLAELLQVSVSSLKRYMSQERDTPDLVAARLHFLALVVGDLAGSYNETGIRRWFQRKRSLLDGRAPAALLTGEWDPDDAAPQKVRQLARELVTLEAT